MLFNSTNKPVTNQPNRIITRFVSISKFFKKIYMPRKQQIHAELRMPSSKITVNVALICFQEGNVHVVYCPSLDLSGYGNDEAEATKSFKTALKEYLRYTVNKHTLQEDLQSRGWVLKKKKIVAPTMSKMLRENKNFQNIFDHHSFKKVDTHLELPALAIC
jgi:hypothetical protein